MTPPPSSPPALPSGALADQVRERLEFRLYGIPLPDPSDALAALAQLVARLEQAERALRDDFPPGFVWSEEEQRPVYKGDDHAPHADRFSGSEDRVGERRGDARERAADSGCGERSGGRSEEGARGIESGTPDGLLADLAACEHTRDQALAALHYIKQQYGPLAGVGWNRLTGDRA